MKKIINWLKSSSSDFALFVILLVLVNIVGFNAFKRIDLTQPKSYSLSKPSRDIVKNLSEPLSIRVFFDKELPAPYNSVAQYVEDFLNEYKSAANKNFTISKMDMNREENIDIASDFGLKPIQIQEYKNNEVGFKQVYMGLVISYGDLVEKIDPITESDGFEYTFTSKISKMINTADVLTNLGDNEKIYVNVYVSNALKKLGINGCDQVENAVTSIFGEINKQKQNRLQLVIKNPEGLEAEELIEKYGVQGISYLNADKESEIGAFGIVVEYGDKFKVLPVLIQQSYFGYAVTGFEGLSEYIDKGIESLVSKSAPIGYIIGNQEVDLNDEKSGYTFGRMLSSMYDVQEIDLVTEDIPAGMNSIIINGPKEDFSEIELYKIDQFVMRGGNAMFFMDAMKMNPDDQAFYAGAPSNIPMESQLDRLFSAYGLKRNLDVVLDKQCYQVSSQSEGKVNLYWAPVLQKKQLDKKHPITSNLGYVLFVKNSSIGIDDALNNKDVKVTVLAKSSDEAWTGDEYLILHQLTVNPPADASVLKSENLAVLVEGKFKSAFDKAPELYKMSESNDSSFETNNHLSESRLPGKIFLIGSSEITTYNVLGNNPDPIGNPVQIFEANLIDYMNGNEDLCKMRSKGLSVNTLTIKNRTWGKIIQYFNEFGLSVLVALIGLLIWHLRNKRKARINALYNPDDKRTIEKTKKNTKKEE